MLWKVALCLKMGKRESMVVQILKKRPAFTWDTKRELAMLKEPVLLNQTRTDVVNLVLYVLKTHLCAF